MSVKSQAIPQLDSPRLAAKNRPSSHDGEFVSLAQTRALLASSALARQQRLDAGDMISTDEAAVLNGTTRVTINAWIAKGKAIGLSQTKRGFRLPAWQFDPQVWAILPELSRALGTTEGWALLAHLETPQGGLDGQTPRQAIERGQGHRVIQLAAGAP